MDWLTQGAIAIGVGFVVWYLTSRVEAIRREKEKLQDERRKIYMQILEPSIRIFAGTKNPSETRKALSQVTTYEYRKAFFELNMLGSDDVVRAVNGFMQYIYGMEDSKVSSKPQDLLVHWGGLLIAIRRDLGNKRTRLKEVDMLRALIKDVDKAITT